MSDGNRKSQGKKNNEVIEPSIDENLDDLTAQYAISIPEDIDDDAGVVEVGDPALNDSLVRLIREDGSPHAIYDSIVEEVAVDLAYLKSSRDTAYRSELPFSAISEKRFKGLKTLADSIIAKERDMRNLDGGRIDFRGSGFRKVFNHFLKVVANTMDSAGIKTTDRDVFFAKLQTSLKGFEDKSESIYLSAQKPTKKKKK